MKTYVLLLSGKKKNVSKLVCVGYIAIRNNKLVIVWRTRQLIHYHLCLFDLNNLHTTKV